MCVPGLSRVLLTQPLRLGRFPSGYRDALGLHVRSPSAWNWPLLPGEGMALRAWKLALGELVATGVVPSQPAWPGNTYCLQVKRQFLRCLLRSCLTARDPLVLFLTMDECGAADVEARVHCPHRAEGDDHASTMPSDTTMEPSLTSLHGFGLRTRPPKDVQRSGRFSNQPKGPFSHRFDCGFAAGGASLNSCHAFRPLPLPPQGGACRWALGQPPLREDGGGPRDL